MDIGRAKSYGLEPFHFQPLQGESMFELTDPMYRPRLRGRKISS